MGNYYLLKFSVNLKVQKIKYINFSQKANPTEVGLRQNKGKTCASKFGNIHPNKILT